MSVSRAVVLLVLVLVLALAASATWAQRPPGEANRLAGSASTYLQQHARNPVDWHPWGPEAIELARREGKPIFLSIGYSACYWCHVANWTLYENAEIARLMNRWFVNVKVDRDERPDIDRIYLRATRYMTGSAGWPNNLFLTPELKPFHAGSYWPREDEPGRPGFVTVLTQMHEEWTKHERRAREKADSVTAALLAQAAGAFGPALAPARWRGAARAALMKDADPVHGGLRTAGGAKFPQAPALALLLTERDPAARVFVARTLEAMALGALHDHVGGGFHRYTLDEGWAIPHFEKMLVDNAQLLALYARAYKATGRRLYRDITRATAAFLLREMVDPRGGFYLSIDATTGRKEGGVYLWSGEEIERVLGAQAAERFLAAHELNLVAVAGEDALVGEERRALRIRVPIARAGFRHPDAAYASFAIERARLLEARNRRPQPAHDRTIVVAMNGLAIEGFAASGAALRAPQHLAAARAAAEHLWRAAFDPTSGALARQLVDGRPSGEAFLEDYALLARGLLVLSEATGEALWHKRAAVLADEIMKRFARPDGRLSSTQRDLGLFMPADEHEDYVHPSGPSAALEVFLRLKEPRFTAAAQRLLETFATRVAARPERWPALAAVAALAQPASAQAGATKGGEDWPTSANRLKATAVARTGGAEDHLRVELAILPGWHVNANPATYAYLIPTQVSVEGAAPLTVRYPAPVRFAPRFVPEAISVYEGRVAIEAVFPRGALARREGLTARLTVQACSDTVCLAPETLEVPVTQGAPPAPQGAPR